MLRGRSAGVGPLRPGLASSGWVAFAFGAAALAPAALLGQAAPPSERGAETRAVELTLRTMVDDVRTSDPLIAPDGETILVVSNRSGRSKLWRLNADGSGARLLVEDEGGEAGPAWSPDGARVAFVRATAEEADIWTVPGEGGTPRRMTRDGKGARDLAWSPDGRRIAFLSDRAGHQDVYVADVETGAVRQLTFETNPWDEFRWRPTWSPDGRWIAYPSNRSDPLEDDLWLVEVETGETRKLTSTVYVMSDPIWSPDGRHIAFNGVQKHEFWYGDQSDIYVVEMPGARLRRVEMNTHVSDRNGSVRMAWSPDGNHLFFRYEWEGDANLWSVPVAGGVATKLTYGKGNLGNFSLDAAGRSLVFTRSTPVRGGEVHRLDLEGGPPVRLTSWTTRFEGLRPPRKMAYRARDGKYILGYLFLPPGFDLEGRYPSLVQVHGGGNNAFGNGFHPLEHLLAREGFVVLAIEYRGSAGHGRAFQNLALGDWGAGQGWDAVDAAEWLRARPWSNGRVGIYGGSYGGIMTLAGLTRDATPFTAAAPLYGIYDWADAYEHGDRLMRFWIIQGHLGFKPGEHPELFERTATLRHLDVIPTTLPLLVIHGELDRRAPFQQSERLVEALRARGNPVEWVSYPDEHHGFRRAENRLDAYGRLLRFFQRHIAGEEGAE